MPHRHGLRAGSLEWLNLHTLLVDVIFCLWLKDQLQGEMQELTKV